MIEPSAISPSRRLAGVAGLAKEGKNVLVRIQPAIYPYIMDELPEMVEQIANNGAKGFIVEGLKMRITMPKHEQVIFQRIGDFGNYDIREWYKKYGESTGSDKEIPYDMKMEYITLAQELADKYKLRFYSADNLMKKCGDSAECCGTEWLRDYKIFGACHRNYLFDNVNQGNCAIHFPNCKVNFVRSKVMKDMTIEEAAKIKIQKMS